MPADRTRWVSEREMRDGLIPAKHGWDEFNLVGNFKRVMLQARKERERDREMFLYVLFLDMCCFPAPACLPSG